MLGPQELVSGVIWRHWRPGGDGLMAARKVKSSTNGRARKKSAKPSVRGGAKGNGAAKPTRRATRSKAKAPSAVKSPRAPRRTETAVVAVAERKPAKKA